MKEESEMLKGKQKRYLRGLGHALDPVITIGKHEISERLIAETDAALAHHELIKVRILENTFMDRHEAAEELASACGAEVAQVLGRTFLLYRRRDEPTIIIPD
jgi:RNA-binding protein